MDYGYGGFAKFFFLSKRRANYGSGWVGPGQTWKKKLEISSQNSPTFTLLKVVIMI